jgi:hypothetical protein
MKPKIQNCKRGEFKQKLRPKRKTTKRALAKGMSKRLPNEILDNSTFKIGLKKIMKNYSGNFALHRKKELYYVGLTTNILGRVNLLFRPPQAET